MDKCSRHRGLFRPPLTPPRFWDPLIIEDDPEDPRVKDRSRWRHHSGEGERGRRRWGQGWEMVKESLFLMMGSDESNMCENHGNMNFSSFQIREKYGSSNANPEAAPNVRCSSGQAGFSRRFPATSLGSCGWELFRLSGYLLDRFISFSLHNIINCCHRNFFSLLHGRQHASPIV